jgi:hypothetical protein
MAGSLEGFTGIKYTSTQSLYIVNSHIISEAIEIAKHPLTTSDVKMATG